jgi:hypothetical protein
MEFTEFPKMPRLSRDCIISEKIDGTNASVIIFKTDVGIDPSDIDLNLRLGIGVMGAEHDGTRAAFHVFAGSRSRFITPDKDNYGFAKFVAANIDELVKLGPGQHFGEWWGSGIQRGYGLTNGDKRFSLFDTRWTDRDNRPACCSVVPILAQRTFDGSLIDTVLIDLAMHGSKAAPGFMRPEGIVVYHTAAKMAFKKTIDKDESPKGAQ